MSSIPWVLVTPLAVSALQAFLALAFFSRGFRVPLSSLSSAWPVPWSFDSSGDVALLNLACAGATVCLALAGWACAVPCVRCGRRAPAAYAVAVVVGALSLFPLAKVAVAPAGDDFFWL
jgi:hypothetical protein